MSIFHKTARLLRGGDAETATGAVILAAGNSTRMGKGQNKQFALIKDSVSVLAYTLLAYQKCDHIAEIVVVARPEDFDAILNIQKQYKISKFARIVAGGATRQESAKLGVSQLSDDIKFVAIADGARCLTTSEMISSVCMRAYEFQCASAAHQITDTVKRATLTGTIKETVDRTGLWVAQTPQVVHTSLYQAALYKADTDKFTVTDDNSLIEHLGYKVKLVECGPENIKITTPEDLELARAIVAYRSNRK